MAILSSSAIISKFFRPPANPPAFLQHGDGSGRVGPGISEELNGRAGELAGAAARLPKV